MMQNANQKQKKKTEIFSENDLHFVLTGIILERQNNKMLCYLIIFYLYIVFSTKKE